ncbi:MAG: 30S ribosomal protein S6 [Phycisphaerales bacterium]|nr:30S ribosomal protein S6 [Phycisphaerales bacterium]
MSETKALYESMFLISQAEAADLGSIVSHIEEILRRGHTEIVGIRKWDERRLAYEIDKQRRGFYLLCYFRAPAESLAHIERDCNLSERILRVMILRADHIGEAELAGVDDRTGLATEAKLRAARAAEVRPTSEPAAEQPAAAE